MPPTSGPEPAAEIASLRARVDELEATLAQQALHRTTQAQLNAAERAARALQDSLFARAPIGMGIVDTDLRFAHVNASLAEMNGISPAAHIGRSVADLLPDLAPTIIPIYRQVLETGIAINEVELQGVTPALPGRERAWLASYYPVLDPSGAIGGVGVVVVEITARKQAEATLRQQAETLREQSEILNLAHVIIRDLESRIVFWNSGAEELYGWTRAEAIGQLSHELFQTRFPLSLEATQAQILQEGEWEGELTHRRHDGSELVVASHQVLLRDSAGRPLRILEVNNDITALKRVEQELRRSAERLGTLHAIDRAILGAETPERIAAVVVSRLQQLVPCDRAAVLIYAEEQRQLHVLVANDPQDDRFPPGSVIPVSAADLLPPFPIDQPWYVPDIDAVEAIAPRAVDYRRISLRAGMHLPLVAEGQMLGALRLSAARPGAFSEADRAVAGEVADQLAIALRSANLRGQLEQERGLLARRITERTADLSVANAELSRTARLKDEFLANMSHELRTPLNAILGRSELLREQLYGPINAQQGTALQSIEEAGRHLLALINDILDLSKVEAGMLQLERAPLNVEDVGHAALRMVHQAAAAKQVMVSSTYDYQVTMIIADELRLKQILVNLLTNAVKFTPVGGAIGLEIRGDLDQQTVTFTVWDTGIGIAPADQQRLFQPFAQVDSSLSRQQAGTGLGLALVRRLTALHGGSVALESEPGAGSRFHIVLPWVQATAPARAPTADSQPPAPIRHALVIDDSLSAVDQITRYLGELGSQVVVHDRAEGALERAAALQPDVIILDILLPKQSGWEVLRQLKADPRTLAIPVLVASVLDDMAQAHALGAAATLRKPLSRETFVQTLRTIRLPDSVAQPPTTALVVAPGAQVSRPLVLLADDNEENVDVLADYLTASGYSTVVASNGVEALVQAVRLRPAIILMDIQMPVLDGLEAIRRIRAAGLATTPIVAVTALAMRGDRERCLAAGADEYLTKPISLRALRDVIERLLQLRAE